MHGVSIGKGLVSHKSVVDCVFTGKSGACIFH